jgi:hypothetical protein
MNDFEKFDQFINKRPSSSVGQSIGLLIRGSWVRPPRRVLIFLTKYNQLCHFYVGSQFQFFTRRYNREEKNLFFFDLIYLDLDLSFKTLSNVSVNTSFTLSSTAVVM